MFTSSVVCHCQVLWPQPADLPQTKTHVPVVLYTCAAPVDYTHDHHLTECSAGSSSCSEDDPSKSPTLGGDKYLRDDDTFFTGKLKASPKRAARRPLGSLNIHAINSSSEESEEDEVPTMLENIPRSKNLTRYAPYNCLVTAMTQPWLNSLHFNIIYAIYRSLDL